MVTATTGAGSGAATRTVTAQRTSLADIGVNSETPAIFQGAETLDLARAPDYYDECPLEPRLSLQCGERLVLETRCGCPVPRRVYFEARALPANAAG